MPDRPPPRNPNLEALWRARGLWSKESFWQLFTTTCKRSTTGIALVDGFIRLSFAEIAARVERLAAGLARLGVARGSVVTVQLPNWWETVVLYWACLRLGAVLNPVLPAHRERELGFVLQEAASEVLVIPGVFRKFDHRAMAARLPRCPGRVVVVRDEPDAGQIAFSSLADGPPAPMPPPPSGEDLLLLMYTSGTTADPKGVLHSHQTLLYEVRSLQGVHSLTERDATLMPSPLTHVSGLIHAVLLPFVLGTRAVLMEQWNADLGLDLLSRESITYMVGAPVFLSDLTYHPELAKKPPTELRLFSCGGAGVSADLIVESRRLLGCVSKRVYGSTEFPTLTTTGPDDPPDRGARTEGRVIGAAELRVVDDRGRDLPPGEEGEMLARGPECFLGYENAALDDEAFTADGWFRTGDLGIVDPEGYLTVSGRKKDIIIRKGEKISAAEIESLIARHPAVADAAVLALPDIVTGERACACVILRANATLTLDELCRFLLGSRLARHKLPEALEIVSELPRTASGKVQKHVLKEQILRFRA
jgi:cyclohexanecarboxylate-CoA ligase